MNRREFIKGTVSAIALAAVPNILKAKESKKMNWSKN